MLTAFLRTHCHMSTSLDGPGEWTRRVGKKVTRSLERSPLGVFNKASMFVQFPLNRRRKPEIRVALAGVVALFVVVHAFASAAPWQEPARSPEWLRLGGASGWMLAIDLKRLAGVGKVGLNTDQL